MLSLFETFSRIQNHLGNIAVKRDHAITLEAVLWIRIQIRIRIRKDPTFFAGSGSGSVTRGYGSGSGFGSETGLKSY
jgi:hypothetical protein